MLQTEWIRSTGAKIAFLCVAIYVVITAITAVVSITLVDQDLDAWLDRSIVETNTYLLDEVKEGGIPALTESVQQHADSAEGENEIYILFDSAGKKEAGNAKPIVTPLGWSDATPSAFGLKGNRALRVLTTPVENHTLVVARSDVEVDEIGDILEKASLTGAVIMAFGALLSAVMLGWETQRRLERFSTALEAIGRGDLNRRVDVKPTGGDDLDTIARSINLALDRLQSAVNAMQHVTVDIAHDLRGPIARVRMRLAESISDDLSEGHKRASLEEALAETDAMTETFESLLRIAQIEAGERRQNFKSIDVSDILRRVHDLYQPLIEDCGGRLALSSDRSAIVEGDAQLITQLLTNIVENAIRHGPTDVTIDLACRRRNGQVMLAVADNGPGIPEEERENVLQRFYRLDKSRSSRGSGLGLALVAAIAELHRARLELRDNAPGLCVELIFPQAELGPITSVSRPTS